MGLDNPIHILLLLIVLLLVFGAKRLPEIGRSLGDGMRGFKESLSGTSLHDSLSAVQVPATELTAAPPARDALAPAVEPGDRVAMYGHDAVARADELSATPKAAA
jgi:sec-independent protein translocase protein TatA